MASIYKRADTWWVHYYVNGQSVDRSLRTQNERTAREKKRKLEAADALDQLEAPSNTPILEVVQQYCDYLVATRPKKSAKNDISYLRAFFGPCCKALEYGSRVPHKFRTPGRSLPKVEDKLKRRHVPVRRLEQISSAMISQFLLDRVVEDGLAPKTVNRQREVLRGLFTFALEHKGYTNPDRRYRNPIEAVRRHREPTPVISWLRDEDIEQQLDVLREDDKLHAMVALYLFSGLRREEALWLTPDDIDLKRRLIRVRAKKIGGQTWQPKTGRNRVVPIGSALLPILKSFHRTQPAQRTWFFLSPQARLTPSRAEANSGGGRWDPDNFSAALRKVNRAAGLNWSCLDYRHTFGSHLAQRGMSLFKIAELMGNSPEICRRHYAALVPERMHDEINFFVPPEPPEVTPDPPEGSDTSDTPAARDTTDSPAAAAVADEPGSAAAQVAETTADSTDGVPHPKPVEQPPRLRLVR